MAAVGAEAARGSAMTTPTIRDLCAALADAVDYLIDCVQDGSSDLIALQECRDRANTARDLLAAAPVVEEIGGLVKWLEEESEAYRQTCGSNLASTNLARAATQLHRQQHLLMLAGTELDRLMAQQLSAPAPVVLPWTHEPSVEGRYLCLREGVYTLHDVDFYRDLQMGIAGQWEATEVCSGNRHGCSVAKLQPAAWLLVGAIPLPQAGEGEV